MKWDIDKALAAIGGEPVIHKAHLTVNIGHEPKAAWVWVIKLGKHLFHGREIHEAYLNMRRVLKKLPEEELASLGVKRPKKRSNSYASARRKKAK